MEFDTPDNISSFFLYVAKLLPSHLEPISQLQSNWSIFFKVIHDNQKFYTQTEIQGLSSAPAPTSGKLG